MATRVVSRAPFPVYQQNILNDDIDPLALDVLGNNAFFYTADPEEWSALSQKVKNTLK